MKRWVESFLASSLSLSVSSWCSSVMHYVLIVWAWFSLLLSKASQTWKPASCLCLHIWSTRSRRKRNKVSLTDRISCTSLLASFNSSHSNACLALSRIQLSRPGTTEYMYVNYVHGSMSTTAKLFSADGQMCCVLIKTWKLITYFHSNQFPQAARLCHPSTQTNFAEKGNRSQGQQPTTAPSNPIPNNTKSNPN